jgi:peptidyl-prolyl cis-trans isomerase C
MIPNLSILLVAGSIAAGLQAAEIGTGTPGLKTKGLVAADLFADPIVAKGKGVEIKNSQVEEAFLAFKGSRAAAGQNVPPAIVPEVQKQILDKLIATRLCLNRAIAADQVTGKEIADKFVADLQQKNASEAAFRSRLIAEGTTLEQFKAQVLEQAVVKAVVDREVRGKQKVTDEEIKRFYTDNPDKFQQPEQVRITHILLSTKNLESGEVLPPDLQAIKKQKIEKVLARARAGEDFAKLIKEFSEDVKQPNGEYTFGRGQMPPELEAAAWSMQPGKISDIVTTVYGYHIVKLMEKFPSKIIEFDKVREKIKESLLQEAVQKAIPDYIKSLQKEANVQIITPD